MGLGPPEGAYENPHRPVGSQEVLTGRLSAPGTPATDEKRRGAAFPGGCARGVFPRRLIGGSDRSLWLPAGREASSAGLKTRNYVPDTPSWVGRPWRGLVAESALRPCCEKHCCSLRWVAPSSRAWRRGRTCAASTTSPSARGTRTTACR